MSIFQHIAHPVFNEDKDPLIPAHFNKSELKALDAAQGKKDVDPKTGIRRYRILGEAFKDPKIREETLKNARAYHASGGRAEISRMKKHGRYGDTEVAYVPRHLADHLDKMIGGKCINPKTGHREYFLGALIAGITRLIPTISRVAARAIPAISRVAAKAVPTITKAASTAAKYALPALKTAGSAIAQAAPSVLSSYQQYQQQQNMMDQQQAMMQMMANMGQQQQQQPQYQQAPQYEMPQMPQYQQQQQQQPQYSAPQEQYSNPYMGQQNMGQQMAAPQNDYNSPYQGITDMGQFGNGNGNGNGYASGGRAKINDLKKKGRYGDTELAYVPSSLQDRFNRNRGAKTVNPHTGLQENFLGPLLMAASMIPNAIDIIGDLKKSGGIAPSKLVRKDGKTNYQKMKDNRSANDDIMARAERARLAKIKKQQPAPQAPENQPEPPSFGEQPYQYQQPQSPQPYQYQYQQPQNQYQQPQSPPSLVSDQTVQQRISGVMDRSPDIINRMQQESQGMNQQQY